MVDVIAKQNPPQRIQSECALRIESSTVLPSVITETALDIHRYICNGLLRRSYSSGIESRHLVFFQLSPQKSRRKPTPV
jgi:hypothetical protein